MKTSPDFDLLRESLAKGQALGGFGQLLGVIAGLRSEDHTTTNPDGRGLVASASAAGPLLAPGLGTGEVHLSLGLGVRGAAAAVGAIGDHGIVDDLRVLPVFDDGDAGGLGGLNGENGSSHGYFAASDLAGFALIAGRTTT
jgi:hypothetical protein